MRPTTSPKLLAILALVGANLTLLPLAAQATPPSDTTTYQTNSGLTQLLLDFGHPTQSGRIEYKTKIQGKGWWGEMIPGTISQQNGKVTVYGTFRDMPENSIADLNPPIFCTGDLVAARSFTNRSQLDVSWKVTGGKKCASIGQTINLTLLRAVPVADAQGDYNYANSRVWNGLKGGQNDYHTWDYWRAIESGSLNCRERPNGKILRSYRQGDDFVARYEGRGTASAILGADNAETNPSAINPNTIKGKPWLLTKDKCFVRSSSQYIQPL